MLPGDFEIPWYPDKSGSFTEKTKAHWCWIGGDWGTASPACIVLISQLHEDMIVARRHLPQASCVCG